MGMICDRSMYGRKFVRVFGNYGHEEILRADLIRHVYLNLPDEMEVTVEFDRYGDIASYTETYPTREEAISRFNELRSFLDVGGYIFPRKDTENLIAEEIDKGFEDEQI